jgi:transposase
MSGKRYTDEFKIEAVKQVTERGHPVIDVAQRLGITTYSLYGWKAKFDKPNVVRQPELDQSAEVRRLKAELKRVTEERDTLKKPPRTLQRDNDKVRVHACPYRRVAAANLVPGNSCASQRLLRLATPVDQ